MRLLVCGGAGFIGSTFVRQRVGEYGDDVTVLDKLTYAGRRENLQEVEHRFVHAGVEDRAAVMEAIADADAVVNFAAETHVDRSIAERGLRGVMHVAGSGACSWYDLAVAAFERTGTDCAIRRGTTAELGRPARRPLFSVLATERDDTPRLPPWEEGLAAHLAASKRGKAGDEAPRVEAGA